VWANALSNFLKFNLGSNLLHTCAGAPLRVRLKILHAWLKKAHSLNITQHDYLSGGLITHCFVLPQVCHCRVDWNWERLR